VSGEQQQDGAGGRDIADLLSGENLDAHRVSASIAAAVRELREQLAVATARAEKAEAELANAYGAGWYDAIDAYRRPRWGAREAGWCKYREQMTADAAQDGLSATETDTEGSQASVDGNASSILPQGLSEPEPERDPSAWCWAPNPHTLLHCGLLRDHEPPHLRGERTWTDNDTTEGR
jgi:hypothetical protein